MASSGTTSTPQRFTGAEFIVHFLERQGIRIVTGIPGGSILPVYDALSQSTQIRHILARHEQGAGFIAQGMARTEGKPAVCMACSGPGATNLVTAIADARLDSIPLICITGQVPASMIGTDAFQEVDTYGISIPITKHNYLVRNINELPQVMSDAFRLAQSGRPGPVWIDVPKDVQTATIELDALPSPAEKSPPPEFSAESIREAAAMINAAKRPVLYLGGGVINAPTRVRELAEKAQLPTTMTLMALGMLPKAHPLSLGMLGMHGARSTNFILQEADLLIVLGARFDDRAIGKTEQFCPNAKIIHVDIDRAELGKIKQPHVAIQADVDDVLAQLIPHIEAQPREAWHQLVAAAKLNSKVLMLTKVGDDIFADNTIRNLESWGINTTYVEKVPCTSSGVAPIFVNANSSNSILIIKGANKFLSPEDIDRAAEDLKKCQLIVLQLEVQLETVYHAIEFGKKHGIEVLLNPAPALRELDMSYACKCDFFVPNETELEILTGMPVDTYDHIRAAARSLVDKGLNNIIVTMGEKGALWMTRDQEVHVPAFRVNAVDTSGAGDAFIGCFAHYYVQSGDVEAAMKKAVLFAAFSVTGKGTQSSYPSIEQFNEYLSLNE